jgi:hypothetical protein
LIDTLVFKVLVTKMADNSDVQPDFVESLRHCAIATVGGTILRALGFRIPVHYVYFYHVFYNKYGLNTAAVFVCLIVMGIIEFIVFLGLMAVLVSALGIAAGAS